MVLKKKKRTITVFMKLLIVELFVIVKNLDQSNCLTVEEWATEL